MVYEDPLHSGRIAEQAAQQREREHDRERAHLASLPRMESTRRSYRWLLVGIGLVVVAGLAYQLLG